MTTIDVEDQAELPDTTQLAEQLDAVIRAVPGVNAVYSAEPLVVALTDTVIDLVTRKTGHGPLVRIRRDGDGVTVTTVIGTDQSEAAGAIGYRTSAAIRDYLDDMPGMTSAQILVRIGRIH